MEKITIDTRAGKDLSLEFSKYYNRTADRMIREYNIMLENILNQKSKGLWKKYWWSQPLFYRNVYSRLFHQCCCLNSIEEFLNNNPDITLTVKTDSWGFTNSIKEKFHDRVKILGYYNKKNILLNFYRKVRLCKKQLLSFFLLKRLVGTFKYNNTPLTIVEHYASETLNTKRYFGDFSSFLTEKEKEKTYFTFNNAHVNSEKKFFSNITLKGEKKIFKEAFLKYYDIFVILLMEIRTFPKILKNSIKFCNTDITDMVNEFVRDQPISFTALYNYKFIKRLRKKNIKIEQLIIWYENQPNDKGLCAAMNKYFPHTPIKGYQGFIISSTYQSFIPEEYEYQHKVIPNEIYVMGKNLIKTISMFTDKPKYSVAPSFRFKHIFNENKNKNTEEYRVVVLLPINAKDALDIIEMLYQYNLITTEKNIHYYIKVHPGMKPDALKLIFNSINFHQITSTDVSDYFSYANIIIAQNSTAYIDAMACAIPLIIIWKKNGITLRPPQEIKTNLYRIVDRIEDLSCAIDFYKNITKTTQYEFEKDANVIRENYFTPISRETVAKFLDL